MVTQNEVTAAYQSGPQHLKDFILSEDLAAVFQNIRTTYNLHIDHAGNLALALNAIILGVRKFDQFPVMLKEALGEEGTPDVIDKVSREVNEKVFVPLRKLAPLAKPVAEAPAPAPTKPPLKEAMPIMAAKMATPLSEPEKLLEADFDHPKVTQLPPIPTPVAPPVPPPTPTPPPTLPTHEVVGTPAASVGAAPPPTSVPTAITPPKPVPPAPAPTPASPVKYHGPDPYHEPLN